MNKFLFSEGNPLADKLRSRFPLFFPTESRFATGCLRKGCLCGHPHGGSGWSETTRKRGRHPTRWGFSFFSARRLPSGTKCSRAEGLSKTLFSGGLCPSEFLSSEGFLLAEGRVSWEIRPSLGGIYDLKLSRSSLAHQKQVPAAGKKPAEEEAFTNTNGRYLYPR